MNDEAHIPRCVLCGRPWPGAAREILAFASFELDLELRELRTEGRKVALQPLVFDLLVHLVRKAGRIVSNHELIEEVWQGVVVCRGAIAQAIFVLRRALRVGSGRPVLIETIRGRGYRFVADVHPVFLAMEGLRADGAPA